MRIAIDGLYAGARHGGVGVVTRRVIDHLASTGDQVIALVPEQGAPFVDLSEQAEHISVHRVAFSSEQASFGWHYRERWEQQALPRALREINPDAYLGPSFTLPLDWRGPRVVMVPDLSFVHPLLRNPPDFDAFHLKWGYRCAVVADQVIVASRSIGQEVMQLWGIGPDRCRVVPLAPAIEKVPSIDQARRLVAGVVGASPNYLLFVGQPLPRKNLEGTISAYALLSAELRERVQLVVVSRRPTIARGLAAEAGVHDQVISLGFCPDELLAALYTGALALVAPSLYEGFGLPAVEAMRCGTPVVTADRGACAETTRGCAVLVDPESPTDIARGITRLLTDEDVRRRLIARGRARVSSLTWEHTCSGLRTSLHEALGRAGGPNHTSNTSGGS